MQGEYSYLRHNITNNNNFDDSGGGDDDDDDNDTTDFLSSGSASPYPRKQGRETRASDNNVPKGKH